MAQCSHAENRLRAGDRRRPSTVSEAAEAPSLQPPVSPSDDALRLLKSEERSNLGEAAKALRYSRRQCQRWFITYRKKGLEELLVSRVGERGPTELITQEAFEELEGAMNRGEIATIAQAHRFLSARGVFYAHPERA